MTVVAGGLGSLRGSLILILFIALLLPHNESSIIKNSFKAPSSKREKVKIQDYTRLSKSHIWNLTTNFYAERGASSWGENIVPHTPTSHFTMAKTYASLLSSYLEDLDSLNPEIINRKEPLYVIEVGPGSGLLGFNFLNALDELQTNFKYTHSNIVYIMADFAESNLNALESHPALQRYFDSGRLDTIRFDFMNLDVCNMKLRRLNKIIVSPEHADLCSESLRSSNKLSSMSVSIIANPILLVLNYIIDTTPTDYFTLVHTKSFEKSDLFEGRVSLAADDALMANISNPKIIESFELLYSYVPSHPDYYSSDVEYSYSDQLKEHLSYILNWYQTETIANPLITDLLVPIIGLRMIDFFSDLSGGRLALFCADKSLEIINHMHFDGKGVHIARHGSISVMANSHLIGLYFARSGGFWAHKDFDQYESVKVSIYVKIPKGAPDLSSSSSRDHFANNRYPNDNELIQINRDRMNTYFPNLAKSFYNRVNQVGPYAFHASLRGTKVNIGLRDLLNRLKLTDWDWLVLYHHSISNPQSFVRDSDEYKEVMPELLDGLRNILWMRYYEMAYNRDLPIDLGLLFAEHDSCEASLPFFNYSISRGSNEHVLYRGQLFEVSYLMGDCYYYLVSKPDEPQESGVTQRIELEVDESGLSHGISNSSLSSNMSHPFDDPQESMIQTKILSNTSDNNDLVRNKSVLHSISRSNLLLSCCEHSVSGLLDCVSSGINHLNQLKRNQTNTNTNTNSSIVTNRIKIAYITYGSDELHSYYPFAVFINALYVSNIGYDFFFYTDKDIPKEMLQGESVDKRWIKIYLIKRFMLDPENRRQFDYVYWIDADLIFIDFSFDVVKYIQLYYNYNMIICRDNIGGNVNTGAFIMKINSWSYNFLSKWWGIDEKLHDSYVADFRWALGDQSRIEMLTAQFPKHIKVLADEAFNSIQPTYLVDGDSPAFHLMGEDTVYRVKAFTIAHSSVCNSIKTGSKGGKNRADQSGQYPVIENDSIGLEGNLGLNEKSLSPIVLTTYSASVERILDVLRNKMFTNTTMKSRSEADQIVKLFWHTVKICQIYENKRRVFKCEMKFKSVVTMLRNYINHFSAMNQASIAFTQDPLIEWPIVLQYAVKSQLQYMKTASSKEFSSNLALDILPLLDQLQNLMSQTAQKKYERLELHRIFGETVNDAMIGISDQLIKNNASNALNYGITFSTKLLEVNSALIDTISCGPSINTLLYQAHVYSLRQEEKNAELKLREAVALLNRCDYEILPTVFRDDEKFIPIDWFKYLHKRHDVYVSIQLLNATSFIRRSNPIALADCIRRLLTYMKTERSDLFIERKGALMDTIESYLKMNNINMQQ